VSAAVDRHAAALARDGWCVFGRAIEPTVIAGIEADLEPRFAATPLCQGAFYGAQTKRFGSLLTRAPAIERLAQRFTVITLGGAHLGGVATLEDRARAPTYQAMFRTLIDLMAPKPGEAILDVGCGAGSLDRLLARRLGKANAITAIDTNPFLLQEAEALAKADGLGSLIRFAPGNAEALPFADASFDCIFSVTVLEECDADRALAEMMRVLRPGGRVGVIVRSIDLPQWWSADNWMAMYLTIEPNMTPPSASTLLEEPIRFAA